MSALPQAATVTELHPEPEFSLAALIDECMDEQEAPDRDALIDAIVTRAQERHLEAVALRQALRPAMSSFINHRRRASARRALGAEADSRWGDVARQQGSGALAIYRWWITLDPEQPPKFFGDCTQAEVEHVAAQYRKRALDMANQAQRFAAVAKTMKERNAETVQNIPVERLVEIFNA